MVELDYRRHSLSQGKALPEPDRTDACGSAPEFKLMTKQGQHAIVVPAHPFWMRLVAFFGLLLILVASSAQASHVHGEWQSHPLAQVTSHTGAMAWPVDEANCPLCIAMHSALPSGIQAHARSLFVVGCRVSLFQDRIASRMLQFSLFSRPPPPGLHPA